MSDNRILRALKALLPQLLPREPYLGPRRYRVVRMVPSASSSNLTRAELQIAQAATGLPDLLIVPVWPGFAGVSSELTPGAHVLVQFVDGDPRQPYVCAFSTPDDPAWKPVKTKIDADAINLGKAAGVVIREGDTVSIAGVGPASGIISITSGTAETPPNKSKVKA